MRAGILWGVILSLSPLAVSAEGEPNIPSDEQDIVQWLEQEWHRAGEWTFDRMLVRLALQRGDLDHAVLVLERIIALHPEDMESRLDLIRLHMLRGDRQQARALLETMPDDASIPPAARERIRQLRQRLRVEQATWEAAIGWVYDTNPQAAPDQPYQTIFLNSQIYLARLIRPQAAHGVSGDLQYVRRRENGRMWGGRVWFQRYPEPGIDRWQIDAVYRASPDGRNRVREISVHYRRDRSDFGRVMLSQIWGSMQGQDAIPCRRHARMGIAYQWSEAVYYRPWRLEGELRWRCAGVGGVGTAWIGGGYALGSVRHPQHVGVEAGVSWTHAVPEGRLQYRLSWQKQFDEGPLARELLGERRRDLRTLTFETRWSHPLSASEQLSLFMTWRQTDAGIAMYRHTGISLGLRWQWQGTRP